MTQRYSSILYISYIYVLCFLIIHLECLGVLLLHIVYTYFPVPIRLLSGEDSPPGRRWRAALLSDRREATSPTWGPPSLCVLAK